MIQSKISDLILPIYWPLHSSNFTASRIYLRGGRYSGKSMEVARYIILSLLNDPTKTKSAIAFRRFSNTLAGSVFNELVTAIYDLHVENEFVLKYSLLC